MSEQSNLFAVKITIASIKRLTTVQQIIQQFKLNHGLFLDENSI